MQAVLDAQRERAARDERERRAEREGYLQQLQGELAALKEAAQVCTCTPLGQLKLAGLGQGGSGARAGTCNGEFSREHDTLVAAAQKV